MDVSSGQIVLKELGRHEIGRPHLFEPEGLCGAGNRANAASQAFFPIHDSQIVIDADGVKKASLKTGLTAST
jgi:hypothetical protein